MGRYGLRVYAEMMYGCTLKQTAVSFFSFRAFHGGVNTSERIPHPTTPLAAIYFLAELTLFGRVSLS